MNFVAVAIFYHFHGNAVSKLRCFGVGPRADILFSAYANFGIVGAAHRNVAAGGAHGNARISGNGFGGYFKVVVVRIPAEIAELQMAAEIFAFYGVDANYDADQKEQADHQEDLSGGNAGGAGLVTAGSAFVELYQSKKNKKKRPPMKERGLKFETTIIVQQKCDAEKYERHTAENTAAAGPGHGGLLALSRIISRGRIRRRNGSARGWNCRCRG